MKRILVILILITITYTGAVSQVRDIKDNLKRDKEKQKTSGNNTQTHYDNDSEESALSSLFFMFYIFKGVGLVFVKSIEGIALAQKSSLQKVDQFPDRRELNFSLNAGFDPDKHSSLYRINFSGTIGIFGGDIRYSQLEDVTGQLRSVDWQILKIYAPIGGFKFGYGVGYTQLYDPEKAYFESTIGFNWPMLHQKLNLRGEYRWTEKKSLDLRYRQEYSAGINFKITNWSRWSINPMISYTYQNYFQDYKINIYQAGVVIRYQ